MIYRRRSKLGFPVGLQKRSSALFRLFHLRTDFSLKGRNTAPAQASHKALNTKNKLKNVVRLILKIMTAHRRKWLNPVMTDRCAWAGRAGGAIRPS